MLSVLSLLFATATTVLGHGYVQEVVTSSGTYTGYLPYSDPYTSPAPERIIRKIPGNGPVEDVTSIDVQCNGYSAGGVLGSAPASLVAAAAAGTESHAGPVITYMARASSDIITWSPGNDAVWFKVAEQGYENGKWAATDILTGENNSIARFTIPASLKAGQYLIRHEIIALHAAYAYPGAQFYPSCIQLEVTDSGTETGPSELVAFPGAYTASTPGAKSTRSVTGPSVWTGGSGSPASSASSASASSAPVSSTSAAQTSVAATTVSPTNTENTTTTAVETAAPSPSTTAAPITVLTSSSTSAAAPSSSTSVSGTVAQYGQCGGLTYTGPTTCVSPSTCKKSNDYYSQCL
ncbi:glycoside hydrolase family 61 protein [Rhizoctonia solani AG-3 Rhs1AP]|uniref:lytic cellulose monooxygenase (C4-dehydrogenating) n=2 Tax=Rhizoctonia solani AG-3 TaxID=1086053 RepID=A0A074RN88_9AGAM|nr:glycoside hydrolase family 61 protein [Rhizoctonia solani AG-3 Rhs1AP]KEP46800.1 glycoside hydrolase family 61 protein [Rhizoctonia solani 123E]